MFDDVTANAGVGEAGAPVTGVSMRPRGAVTIGGDAAGAIVVVVDAVVVDDVDDVVVVVERALSDEPHAAHAISNSTHALLRPRRRCTPS
jgi:hypothetical protein